MARKYTEYRHVCAECHEVFYSTKIDAKFHSNACKMRDYRRRKAQAKLEQKFDLDAPTLSLYQQIVDRRPELGDLLVDFLKQYEQSSFKRVLEIVTIAQTGNIPQMAQN